MTDLGIVVVILAFVGIVLYYIRLGINATRDAEALEAQNKAQENALAAANKLAADQEREERQREAAEVNGISRDAANKLLLDALKDDVN